MEVKVKAKKQGSSIGVIIKKSIVESKRIKENDEITIVVEKKKPKAGVLFGMIPNWKKSGQEIKDEMKLGWESKSDKKMREKWKSPQMLNIFSMHMQLQKL